MPRPLPQHVLARRALVEEHDRARPDWVRQTAATVGISVLGLAVAGSVAVSGSAQDTSHPLGAAAGALVIPATLARADRSAVPALAPESLASSLSGVSDQRTQQRLATERGGWRPTLDQALQVRTQSLRSAAEAANARAAAIKRERDKRAAHERDKRAAHERDKRAAHERAVQRASLKRAVARRVARAAAEAKQEAAHRAAEQRRTKRKAAEHRVTSGVTAHPRSSHATGSAGHASRPITSGYRVAARFGQTGVWSRYHTGLDFAAPRGTTIRAVLGGVVTHAGPGSAGWAGRYVTIRHADGRSTLYAHMSSVSVHAGEHVSGGERIGSVGMTGCTFGPHLHVELYPRGVRPGKVYSAINPAPWMRAHGVHI